MQKTHFSAQALPLAGIRVIDYSHFLAGPYVGRCLAALGAEVIKVERPTTGDAGRQHAWMVGDTGQHSGYFLQLNMGKQGVSVNMKDPRGKVFMQRLCDSADVFIENYRPGALDKLGLGYAELAARKAAWVQPKQKYERGYGYIFAKHVMQAELGCDFDFLETSFGAPVSEPDIF